MNPDQRQNVETDVEALLAALSGGWANFRVLNGLHTSAKAGCSVDPRFNRLIDELWRATFNSLHMAVASLADRTKNVQSLPNLTKKLRRYNPGDLDIKALCDNTERNLSDPAIAGVAKSEFWRNNSIAHNTPEGRDPEMYERNKSTLADLQSALEHLDTALNSITVFVHNTHNDVRHQAIQLEGDASELMRRLSA